jgi:hypothetical protein
MTPVKDNVRGPRLALIAAVGMVGALLLLAVGAWAYDNSQKDKIAPGVTIGGVDVGGMDADEARSLIRKEVVAPLQQEVSVRFGDETYTLTPEQLKQRADVAGMVEEATEESREGGFVGRLGRYVSGGEVDADVAAEVHYSKQAVRNFVETLADEINRDPVNATVIPSGDSLARQPGEKGIDLRNQEMTDLITARIEQPLGPRTIAARVRRTTPEITRKELAEAYPTFITVDRASFTLRLFKNLKLEKSYPIAVGQAGYDTPAGLYDIQTEQVNPYWYVPDAEWAGELAGTVVPPGPDNPLQARWLGIYDGAGIHGTNEPSSIGTAASHGCIRMLIPDVIELSDQVGVGTPVYIS